METLFSKVCVLLMLCMIAGSWGTFVGQYIKSVAAWIGIVVVYFVGAIALFVGADAVSPPVGAALLFGWSFVTGLVIGPAIEAYSEQLGWRTVALAFAGTAGVMALCGMIGMLSGVDFSGLGSILGIALFGLIIVGVIGMFVRMSRHVNIGVSIIGMIVFAGYFVFDFFRIGKEENTWGNAIRLAMNIYLDFINFFLYLLQLLAEMQKNKN